MDAPNGSLRRSAFARLAALSNNASNPDRNADVERLGSCLPKRQANGYLDGVLRAIAPSSRLPMTLRELDVLLALCATAPRLTQLEHAERLVEQLGDYLPEAHTQLLTPSPYLHEIKPSPWAALTSQLTQALLVLGLKFPSLKDVAKEKISSYIYNWTQASTALATAITGETVTSEREQEAVEMSAVAVSMIGFLESATEHRHFWTPRERLQLIKSVKDGLSEQFLVALEKATSTILHSAWNDPICRDWKRCLKLYAAKGVPLGAMLLQQSFMSLVVACTSSLLLTKNVTTREEILQHYMGQPRTDFSGDDDIDEDMIEHLAELITAQMAVLEDGSDYLQLGSAWQQRLAFQVKALALEAFLHCMVINEDFAEAEDLQEWLEDSIQSQPQMTDPQLSSIVMRGLAVIAKYVPGSATSLARVLLRFVVQGTSQPSAVDAAAESLAQILQMLSQDAIITTLYSLGNVLSSQPGADKQHQAMVPLVDSNGHHSSISSLPKERAGSVISLSLSGDEETSLVCGNVARAIVTIAISCRDGKIIALSQTMLLQKIGRVNIFVDAHIIEQAARLSIYGKENEFGQLLRLLTRVQQGALHQNSTIILEAVTNARQYIAEHIDNVSPMFKIFALQMLERLLSKGDTVEGGGKHAADVEQIAREIGPLLKPLATVASRQPQDFRELALDEHADVSMLSREAWFNVAVHGITLNSQLGQLYQKEMRLLAMFSSPLIDPARAELLESDVELNTVLRRNMSSQHTSEQKKYLASIIPEKESEIRHLSYQKVVFLNAIYLLESLRVESGTCTEILQYFADPALVTSHMGSCLSAIADTIIRAYIRKVLPGRDDDFSASHVARQLTQVLCACCHRSAKMQEVARAAADHIITFAPSALCQKSAIFALLELLTLMWSSCLDAEIDEYGWKPVFSSARGKVTIEQSDDYAFRRRTLDLFYSKARGWMTTAIAIAPLDVKGLLQTYLSEFDDTGSYGHISLGRSFAVEMGSSIPAMDQRLVAIEHERQPAKVNVASDFIAQYTTRQEYRFAGASHGNPLALNSSIVANSTFADSRQPVFLEAAYREARSMLSTIHQKIARHEKVPDSDLNDVLRRAAALLCRSKGPETAIVRHLVQIPFEIMDKDSIKMGISLWLGVIHESPRVEPRILTEVAHAWERTIDRRIGIFSPHFTDPDPFYVKMEFAPSDREALHKQQVHAQSMISPHLRVLQFFQSHFNAIRLGSSDTQRSIVRMLHKSLDGFVHLRGHPLLREIHFQLVLFGLNVLQYSTCLNKNTAWRLRDKIIATGLHWFSHPPYWSFGSNRLQLKAEVRLMQDVLAALASSRNVGVGGPAVASQDSSQSKSNLLDILVHSEIGRLQAWLQPIGAAVTDVVQSWQVLQHVRTAWAEDPALAVQLATRFPSAEIRRDVRLLLTTSPDKALHEPNAVELLLGDDLPSDLTFQLKYLLLWSAVNPIQAVTYFMPGYGNHPFILQYAMRALDSHSVDITFFYVPQIVQCLRYDALGYVERYIIETGSFSQLFAHQIIWNMKANAYKDDDSTIEDPMKPTLDKVMDGLISSFSGEDKAFYEREFAFFGEVTDISGKLKPFIKKSKPEKKAKIEEELRKIKVEVGVYLPSNPDGVVVGIDRKSGKPLQSHAKAPYMATFRIRKTRDASEEDTSKMIEDASKSQALRPQIHARNQSSSAISVTSSFDDGNSYEVWQSAIFKVGDDCRQDVLALQMIAAFRGIFNSIGLDVYVFPYRVTATAPGCGVIDVLPNSISRDMLGRETVNGLYDYFITKYGSEHSVRFQEARSEFVKSMAAYSVISYLLQFKDRHNGNIMIDDKGHILHIDFGFCFDIAPGGVKFERAPFKLTPEMLAVMGGSDPQNSQAFRWFEELTIKSFLSCRQYCDKLCHLVMLMLDSGLPCFKPETIKNFRSRFVLEKTEKEAAAFMQGCIRKSAANLSTKVYDEFQLITNGIPY